MLFNSFEFILLYLPVVIIVYFRLNRLRLATAANAWLLFVSLFFYGWWNVRYLPLILGSILFNYTVASLIAGRTGEKGKGVSRRGIFVTGIAGNILLLGYFKYTDFFIGTCNAVFGTGYSLLHIALPLGISFFTITQIAFLVDAYEGLVEETNLLSYALFVTFFPYLLAGPIVHHRETMPQFDAMRNKVVNYRNLTAGLYLFLLGLCKKVLIADTIAQLANAGFSHAATITLLEAWVASLSYTLQLYFDFSGYSDMAIGIGWMFNVSLPQNFNSPYKATNIIDFWKRWHITLTNFITTYVFTPILRSFGSVTFGASLAAIVLAMLISGLWHGAGWTFIIWGGLHGIALAVNHLWRRRKLRMGPRLGWLITFGFVNFSLVFFRAKDVGEAFLMLRGMLGANGIILPAALGQRLAFLTEYGASFGRMFANISGHGDVAVVFAALLLAVYGRNTATVASRATFRVPWPVQASMVFLILVNFLFLNTIRAKEFIYFGF